MIIVGNDRYMTCKAYALVIKHQNQSCQVYEISESGKDYGVCAVDID